MARGLYRLLLCMFLLVLSVAPSALGNDGPESSPSPHPDLSAGSPPTPSSSPSPSAASPPSPPQNPAPGSSPTPAPAAPPSNPDSKQTPTPAPSDNANDVVGDKNATDEESKDSSGGLKGGQKAGIAIGVIAGLCIVGFGGLVYKRRQQNLQRSQFGYAARREIL